MLKVFWIFKNLQEFRSVFNGKSAAAVRQLVVRRGWHHLNMQAVAYVTLVCILYSKGKLDEIAFAGLGFLCLAALIYANTQRNIKFTELL